MEPRSIYALSDVHGHLAPLNAALELIDLAGNPGDQLVLLGDYIDRGPRSLEVLSTVKTLTEFYGGRVVALAGNHERDFLVDFLSGGDEDFDWVTHDPDLETLRSLLDPEELGPILAEASEDLMTDPDALTRFNGAVKRAVLTKHSSLIAWMRQLPLFYEAHDHDHVYVHAGVDETAAEHWRLMTDPLLFTHKYPASTGPWIEGKTLVAGHVGCSSLNEDGSHRIYHDAGHIYLDGNVPLTGVLNVLRYRMDTKTYEYLSVSA